MSSSEQAVVDLPVLVGGTPPTRYRGAWLRLIGSELRLVFGRRRNAFLLAFVAAVPLLVGVAIKINGPPVDGEGPRFLAQVTTNGVFLVFTGLVLTLPLLLPLVIGIVSGDTVAGEAGAGTLRYLLALPVSRGRLLVAKVVGAGAYAAAAVALLSLVAVTTGAALFPVGRVTLLSGQTVGYGEGLGRAALVALYVIVSLAGLVVIGLLLSVCTEVPVAAMAATILFAVISEVLDNIPQLHVIQPYLLTHHWLDFGELLRPDPRIGVLLAGIGVQVGYVVVGASLAWSKFSTADVTS